MGCSCGYRSDEAPAVIKEEMKHVTKEVKVADKDESGTLPLTDNKCKKCEHPRSYFWEVQTRAADEPATRFYKCEKCKHIWREYK